jgi:hypothetical protein
VQQRLTSSEKRSVELSVSVVPMALPAVEIAVVVVEVVAVLRIRKNKKAF